LFIKGALSPADFIFDFGAAATVPYQAREGLPTITHDLISRDAHPEAFAVWGGFISQVLS